MGESTGRIDFINSADYVSDVLGTHVSGCTATLLTEDGQTVVLYTQSLRLHHTLEMAYATGKLVTADYAAQVTLAEERGPVTRSTAADSPADFEGPFRLQAMWTLE